MADALSQLAAWASPLLAGLAPARRRMALVQVATYLRRSQAERIAAQSNPDGSPFEPRKPQPRMRAKRGAIRRKMFEKLRTAKYLRKSATTNAAIISIGGRTARIARVHQYGLRDLVDWRRPDTPTVRYARRELLGFTRADEDAITDILLLHITAGP